MKQAQTGDKVAVHYKGTRSDGAVFDSSLERDPIQFTIGGGEVIAGFDDALVDMIVGDTKTVTIAPEEAYGPHNPELVHVVERNQLPAELDLKVGAQLQATDPNGNGDNPQNPTDPNGNGGVFTEGEPRSSGGGSGGPSDVIGGLFGRD